MKERNKLGHIFSLIHLWTTEYLISCCCRRLSWCLSFLLSIFLLSPFVFSATQQLMCWKMFFNELIQFTNAVENITVFCKFSKWTKGGVQQVPACMNWVRVRVRGEGKHGPSGFDGGVIMSALGNTPLWLLSIHNSCFVVYCSILGITCSSSPKDQVLPFLSVVVKWHKTYE